MAIKATLKFDGFGPSKEYTIVEFQHLVNQEVGIDGTIQSGPCGGNLVITLDTPENSCTFYELLMKDTYMLKGNGISGKIILTVNVNRKQMSYKTIVFKDACCTNIFEYFNNQSSSMMTTRIVLHANEIYFVDGDGMAIGLDTIKEIRVSAPSSIGSSPKQHSIDFL